MNGLNTFTAIGQDSVGDLSTNSVAVNLPATNNYSYDLNGNLLSDGTRSFAYDDENELIGVCVSNAWSNSFAYDGKMRRRIERDYTWQSGAWVQTNEVHFIYDGNVVIEERNANNTPLVSYTRGNDLSGTFQGAGGIGGLLARTTYGQELPGAPTTAFYHADGNGNITALMYSSQQLAAKYLYDPFGNMLAMSGPLMNYNKYRFSSKEWNNNAGLYYYLYRFNDPSLQRWINRDPIEELGFEVMLWYRTTAILFVPNEEVDLFEFVDNQPTSILDINGLTGTTSFPTIWPPAHPFPIGPKGNGNPQSPGSLGGDNNGNFPDGDACRGPNPCFSPGAKRDFKPGGTVTKSCGPWGTITITCQDYQECDFYSAGSHGGANYSWSSHEDCDCPIGPPPPIMSANQ